MPKFRFQDLKIWQLAIEIADELFDIADELEKKRLYRFAEQLRGSGLSMSNNIAECSTFENANILMVLNRRGLIEGNYLPNLLDKLDYLSRQISSFQRSLAD